jgi:hypothetical protein
MRVLCHSERSEEIVGYFLGSGSEQKRKFDLRQHGALNFRQLSEVVPGISFKPA